ncbi:hypothetical protein FQR65_LT09573 [Abscondita terminalis]|nr:hypothetical protein FQR65_LT09573 [Abscondita terminalis]
MFQPIKYESPTDYTTHKQTETTRPQDETTAHSHVISTDQTTESPTSYTTHISNETTRPHDGFTVPVVTVTPEHLSTVGKETTLYTHVSTDKITESPTDYTTHKQTETTRPQDGYTVPVVTVTPEHLTTVFKETTAHSHVISTDQTTESATSYTTHISNETTRPHDGFTVPVVTVTPEHLTTDGKETTLYTHVSTDKITESPTDYTTHKQTETTRPQDGYTVPVVTYTTHKQTETTRPQDGYTVPVVTVTPEHLTTVSKETTAHSHVISTDQTTESATSYTTHISNETTRPHDGVTVPVVTVTPEHLTTDGEETTLYTHVSTDKITESPTDYTTHKQTETTRPQDGYTVPVVTVTPEHLTTVFKETTAHSHVISTDQTTESATSYTTHISNETTRPHDGFTVPVVTVTPEHLTTDGEETTLYTHVSTDKITESPTDYTTHKQTETTRPQDGYTVPVVTVTPEHLTTVVKETTAHSQVNSTDQTTEPTDFSTVFESTMLLVNVTEPVITTSPLFMYNQTENVSEMEGITTAKYSKSTESRTGFSIPLNAITTRSPNETMDTALTGSINVDSTTIPNDSLLINVSTRCVSDLNCSLSTTCIKHYCQNPCNVYFPCVKNVKCQ